MAMTKDDLVQTARLTLTDPRQGARVVMGWPLTLAELWAVLALMAVLSALLAEVLVGTTPEGVDPAMAALLASPVRFAALQFVGLGLLTGLLFALGRPFGGTGRFREALALVGWLQTILLALQIAQIVAILVLPFLALLIVVASVVATLWLLTNFTAELHGFRSLFLTLIGIIAAFMALIVAMSIALIVFFGVGT